MKKIFMLIVTGVLMLSGCGKSVNGPLGPSSPVSSGVTQQIGTSGGTVSAGVVSISIPAGALPGNVNISVAPIPEGAMPAAVPAGKNFVSAVVFGPDGTSFNPAATITFALKEQAVAGSVIGLYLYNAATGAWTSNGSATVSADGKSASATVTHFSSYALMKSASGVVSTARLSNHFISSGDDSKPCGFFDFSAGVEVNHGQLNAGDMGFRCADNVSIEFVRGEGTASAGAGLKLYGTMDIEGVTSVPDGGYLTGVGGAGSTESDFVGKVYAVKSNEGSIYVFQVTAFSGEQYFPAWVEFKWKQVQ